MDDIVIVGHSMAGMTLPGVVTKLGAARVREMIFGDCIPSARRHVDRGHTHRGQARRSLGAGRRRGVPSERRKWMARFIYMNGVPSHRRRFMTGKLYAESLRILTEKVSRREMPDDIPRTWILTLRDRALAPKLQRKYIEAIGGVQTLIEIDTCHC